MYLTIPNVPSSHYILFKQNISPVMICSADIFLASSVLLETLSTICLKKTLNNKLWFVPVYIGYGISFWTFPKALRTYSLSLSYAIWSGCGIILTTIFDKLLYNEVITFKRIFACILIIIGLFISK